MQPHRATAAVKALEPLLGIVICCGRGRGAPRRESLPRRCARISATECTVWVAREPTNHGTLWAPGWYDSTMASPEARCNSACGCQCAHKGVRVCGACGRER